MLLFVYHEYSYDRYNKNADRIYSVAEKMTSGNEQRVLAMCPTPLGPILKKNIPSIKNSGQLIPVKSTYKHILVSYDDTSGYESHLYYATPSLFQMFTLPVIYGHPGKGLNKPGTIAISQSISQKYFGNTDPVGKKLKIKNHPYEVVTVFKDLPANSSFQINILISFQSLPFSTRNDWHHRAYTFLLLKKHSDARKVGKQIQLISKPHLRKRYLNITSSTSLMPLLKMHLHSRNLLLSLSTSGYIAYVYFFGGIAFLLLIIGLINFVLLTTARIRNHESKDAAYGKMPGFYMSNSLLIHLMALIIAVLLTYFFLPYFNFLMDNRISIAPLFSFWGIGNLLLVWILISLFSSYASTFLSSSLKYGKSSRNISFRKIWLVLEVALSGTLIICSLVIHQQLNFTKSTYLNVSGRSILLIPRHGAITNSYPDFRSELLRNPNIHQVTTTSFSPGSSGMRVDIDHGDIQDAIIKHPIWVSLFPGDNNFVKTFHLKIIEGRDFSPNNHADSSMISILINEAAVKTFGWKHPLGKRIKMFGKQHKVIGVIKDFYFASLKNPVSPAVVLWVNEPSYFIAVLIDHKDTKQTIQYIRQKWDVFSSHKPMEYTTVKQQYDHLYDFDYIMSRIFYLFTIITILLTLTSALALTLQLTDPSNQDPNTGNHNEHLQSKTKDLVYNVLTLTLTGFLISIPFGWFLSYQWLQNFVYRIHYHIGIFLLTGIFEIILTMLALGLSLISRKR